MRANFIAQSPTYQGDAEALAARLGEGWDLRFGSGDIDSAQVLVTAGGTVDAAMLERTPAGLIQTIGTGFDNIDLAAATRLGVWVGNLRAAATGNAESVAEHALLLMLALARQLPAAQANTRTARWAAPRGVALLGKTACIVGLGDIGAALAARLLALGMKVIGLRTNPARGGPAGVEVGGSGDLHAALAKADFAVLCVRASEANRGLIGDRALAAMKPSAYLVNIARGTLIDERALAQALRAGRLAGAGLDVFDTEPVDPAHPLLALPNVIATPHVAGSTDVHLARALEHVAVNLERYARGEPPEFPVNAPLNPRRALRG